MPTTEQSSETGAVARAQQLGALPSPGSSAERLTLAAFNMKTRLSRALRR